MQESSIHASIAGGTAELAAALVARTRAKSDLPEPLRLAHLFAHALVRGDLPARVVLRDLGLHQLKDLAEPEQVFQLAVVGLGAIAAIALALWLIAPRPSG